MNAPNPKLPIRSRRQILPPSAYLWLALIGLSASAGCNMCCGPYDFDYPTFGGKHERIDRAYGRVGSIFSDPNAGYYGESPDANLEPRPEREPNRSTLEDEDDDFRRELESISPREDSGGADELPQPDDSTDPTASTLWRERPASRPQWR
jgi:hypothetical protein